MTLEEYMYEVHGFYEESRTIEVPRNSWWVRCPHPKPSEVSSGGKLPERTDINIGEVELKEHYYNQQPWRSVHMGKCECGKVYYFR